MRIEPFEYLRPLTAAEACAVLAELGPAARVVGGGSDLLVRMKLGIQCPKFLIDLKAPRDLEYIRAEDGGLSIGAATTLRTIERSVTVAEGTPALAQAAARVASVQIRNWATIGGNLCLDTMCWFYNQSRLWKMSRPKCNKAGGTMCYVVNKEDECYAAYRGDTATALIALGAKARLASLNGEREVPVEELFSGDGKAPLRIGSDEILKGVWVPCHGPGSSSTYIKLSHRKAIDYPQLGVGVWVSTDGGVCTDVRIALGAVGSGPVRARAAEELLRGGEVTAEAVIAAANLAVRDAHPVNNLAHASPSYRRKMVAVLARRGLEKVLEEARE